MSCTLAYGPSISCCATTGRRLPMPRRLSLSLFQWLALKRTSWIDTGQQCLRNAPHLHISGWLWPKHLQRLASLSEVFTFPSIIHIESTWNPWNPWNQCWLRPQPIHCSMDIMDSMWNDHGMVMEWSIPYGIHHYSIWIPLDSMVQIPMELMTIIPLEYI